MRARARSPEPWARRITDHGFVQTHKLAQETKAQDSDARENHCLGRCLLQTLEIKFLVCRSSALWQVTFK